MSAAFAWAWTWKPIFPTCRWTGPSRRTASRSRPIFHKGFFDDILRLIGDGTPTLRDVYLRYERGRKTVTGGPARIADVMEEWFTAGAADGFMLQFHIMPRGLELFVQRVVPELQRRGLMRTDYAGATLRENLGLRRPARGGRHGHANSGVIALKYRLAACLAALPALAWAAPPTTVAPGKLTWGTSPTFAPFEFQRDDKTVGFDVDMMAELGKRTGLQSTMLGMDFTGIVPAVQSGRIDAAVSGMYITAARLEVVDFIPYLRIGDQLVVPKGNPGHIAGKDALCGHHMVVVLNTQYEKSVHAISDACTQAGKPGDRHAERGQQCPGIPHAGPGPGGRRA